MTEWLLPGEMVIKDSGKVEVSYAKEILLTINGRLYLTNMRLIFIPSKFQDPLVRLMGLSEMLIQIPLQTIKSVEKEALSIIVKAGEKYRFDIALGIDEWLSRLLLATGEVKQNM